MNSKLNFLFLLLAVLVVAVFSQKLNAENIIPNKTINIQGLALPDIQECKLIDKIKEAKQLLENSPPLQFKEEAQKNKKGKIIKKKGQPVMEITEKEISLAILDTEMCQIFEKRYWLNMIEINKASDLRKKYLPNPDNLPMFRSGNSNEEFSVINNWWNSFNSDWSIAKNGAVNSRFAVIADKCLMSNEDLAYPEDRIGEKYSDIVYVPYSNALKDKTLIAVGKQFLNDHVSASFKELAEAGVVSKAFPNRLVTETMTQAFVKNIFLTEQTDPKMMIFSADGGKELVERVFIRLGANGEKAFRYTVSKTGASGLGQIMPRTYLSMLWSYLSALLIKDVEIGRVDVKNGVKATVLVLDDHLQSVKNRAYTNGLTAKRRFDALTPDKLEEVRGMAYNGGPSKYNTSTGGLNTKSPGAKETAGFLEKFRMIRELNLFEQYAEAAQ